MSKLTPEQAFAHLKAVWPDLSSIESIPGADIICRRSHTSISQTWNTSPMAIDWPEGVHQWPPKGQWRDARLEDLPNKMRARVRDSEKEAWLADFNNEDYFLIGVQYLPALTRKSWITHRRHGGSLNWQYCQVWDESL